MSEDKIDSFDWRKTTLKSVGAGLGAAGREIKMHTTEAVEGAKEKINFVKDAARAVLNKEFKKFSELPNLGIFLPEAAFGLAVTGTVVGGMITPLIEGLIRMATVGTSVVPAGTQEQGLAIATLATLDLLHIGLASEAAVITFDRIKKALSPATVKNG